MYRQEKMYKFLLLMAVVIAVGFQGWRSVFNNYAVEIVGFNGQQMGLTQSIREIPGLLAFLVIYLTFIFKEHKLGAICVALTGLGIGMTGLFPSFYGVVFATLIMSFGFHYYETVNQSLALQYFSKLDSTMVLARIRSVSSGINIFASGMVFVLAMFFDYKTIFLIIGAFVVIWGIYFSTQNPARTDLPLQHKKMIFKKKYWLFYVLTLLSGSRRQIFVAFAVFLLVQKFKFSIQEIALLFIVNNVINYLLMPYVGRMINKFGERFVLSIEYTSLIFIFLVYAYSESKMVVGIMYVLDHIFFNFAIAIKSYFKHHADSEDIAPSMAVGFTINHIAAVILPAIGGALWMIDDKIPFLFGAGLSVVSLIFVQMMKAEEKSMAKV